jgi:hypothetical protein
MALVISRALVKKKLISKNLRSILCCPWCEFESDFLKKSLKKQLKES